MRGTVPHATVRAWPIRKAPPICASSARPARRSHFGIEGQELMPPWATAQADEIEALWAYSGRGAGTENARRVRG